MRIRILLLARGGKTVASLEMPLSKRAIEWLKTTDLRRYIA